MNYLQNHIWCSDSNWGGRFSCKHLVSLCCHEEGYKEDWEALITKKEFFDSKLFDRYKDVMLRVAKHYGTPINLESKDVKAFGNTYINTLKPEVIQWLEDNIPDNGEWKGWCIGSDEYVNSDSSVGYSIFFQRKKDAMLFIKTWSVWEKPIHYYQYFTDVRKTLNLETLKYEE